MKAYECHDVTKYIQVKCIINEFAMSQLGVVSQLDEYL